MTGNERRRGGRGPAEYEGLDEAFRAADWFVSVCRRWLDQHDLTRAYATSLPRHLAHLVAAADRLDRLRFQLIRCDNWLPGDLNHAPFEPIMHAYSEFYNVLDYVVSVRMSLDVRLEKTLRDLQAAAKKATTGQPFRLVWRGFGGSSPAEAAEDEMWLIMACDEWMRQPELDQTYSPGQIEAVQQVLTAAHLFHLSCAEHIQLIIGITGLRDDRHLSIDPVMPVFWRYSKLRERLQLSVLASASAVKVFFQLLEDSAREAAANPNLVGSSSAPQRVELKLVHRRK